MCVNDFEGQICLIRFGEYIPAFVGRLVELGRWVVLQDAFSFRLPADDPVELSADISIERPKCFNTQQLGLIACRGVRCVKGDHPFRLEPLGTVALNPEKVDLAIKCDQTIWTELLKTAGEHCHHSDCET